MDRRSEVNNRHPGLVRTVAIGLALLVGYIVSTPKPQEAVQGPVGVELPDQAKTELTDEKLFENIKAEQLATSRLLLDFRANELNGNRVLIHKHPNTDRKPDELINAGQIESINNQPIDPNTQLAVVEREPIVTGPSADGTSDYGQYAPVVVKVWGQEPQVGYISISAGTSDRIRFIGKPKFETITSISSDGINTEVKFYPLDEIAKTTIIPAQGHPIATPNP